MKRKILFGVLFIGLSILSIIFLKIEGVKNQIENSCVSVEEKEAFLDTIQSKAEVKETHPIYEKFGIKALFSMKGKIYEIDSLNFPPYYVYRFRYSKEGKCNYHYGDELYCYGNGLVISKKTNGKETLIWKYFVDGDFPPHTLNWININADKQKDLFLLIGMEDVFVTKIFINNIKEGQGINKNFTKVYENNECYATLIDIENNNTPELIVANHDFTSFQIPDSLRTEIDNEYDRIVGAFNNVNSGYNMPNDYKKQHNLFLTEKYQILRFKNDTFIDATKEYVKHLNWRREILEKVKIQEDSEDEWLIGFEKPKLEEVKSYLDSIAEIE